MSMEKFEKKIISLTDTPFGYTLSMIGGKWRLVIPCWLAEYDSIRFNELASKNRNDHIQNSKRRVKRNGCRRPCHPQRIPADPAESRVQLL